MKAFNGYGGISKLSGKRRRPYWVRITTGWDVTPTGKPKQLYETLGYYATRKEAMIALANYHQNPIDLAKKDITFSEVWEAWTPAYFKRTPSSENGMRASYKRCESLHNMAVKDIRKVHMQSIIDSMRDMSEQSQKKVKTVFKMTFKYCLENDLVTKDYSQFVTIESTKTSTARDKFFTTEEIEKVLSGKDCEAKDAILILLHTGMRVGEFLEVRPSDIVDNVIHIRGTKTDNADRFVPIHRDIQKLISDRMNKNYLIQDEKGKKLSYNSFKRRVFTPFLTSIGIDHTPHATRHTFISLMDSAGANMVALKRIVGHSNAGMTEHYTHKQISDLIEAIELLKIVR